MGTILTCGAAVGAIVALAAVESETGMELPDYTWIKAIVICGLHLLATRIRPVIGKYDRMVNSFAGGMAATYIFLQLLPEVDEGHAVVGNMVYLFVLIGFVTYYGIEKYIHHSKTVTGGDHHGLRFRLLLRRYWFYNWLMIFGLPDGPGASVVHVALITLAMGMDLVHGDYSLGSEYPQQYDRWGRFAIASAPLVGLACRIYLRPEAEVVKDIMTAFLAGSIVYSVFRSELPHPEKASFRWFSIGIIGYTLLVVLARNF